MAVEPTLASASFSLIAVELPLGEFAAEVHKYMDARKKDKQASKESLIEDLRAMKAIVMRLTDSYIQSMQHFMDEDTISDPTKLKVAIKEAKGYLQKRQILPNFIELANEFKGQGKKFPQSLSQYFSSTSIQKYLDAVYISLDEFQEVRGRPGHNNRRRCRKAQNYRRRRREASFEAIGQQSGRQATGNRSVQGHNYRAI